MQGLLLESTWESIEKYLEYEEKKLKEKYGNECRILEKPTEELKLILKNRDYNVKLENHGRFLIGRFKDKTNRAFIFLTNQNRFIVRKKIVHLPKTIR